MSDWKGIDEESRRLAPIMLRSEREALATLIRRAMAYGYRVAEEDRPYPRLYNGERYADLIEHGEVEL